MPPKAKFAREEIIAAALEITRKNGIEALTARALAEQLGSSARPVFTVFQSMEEVQEEVRSAAMKVFEACVEEAAEYTPAFKQIGVVMIRFAVEEPKLFRLLYMQEHAENRCFDDILKYLGDTTEVCLELLQKEYGLTAEEAYALFQQTWIFTFGICVLCATGACRFSEAETEELLGREFMSMLMLIKAGKLDTCKIHPERKKTQE